MTIEIIRGHPKVPVGGWRIHIHGQTFRGKDVDEVIAALTDYRTQNSLPLGNPEADIAAYHSESSPHLVRVVGQAVESNGPRQRVAEHTMGVWYGKYDRLNPHDPMVVKRRGTCALCPHFRTELLDAETSYSVSAFVKATMMTGDLDCLAHGWCIAHGWLLGLATRLVTPQKVATMPVPAGCWLSLS